MFPHLVLSEAILFQYLSIMHETSILWLWVVIPCSHFWKEASCLSLCRSKEFWLSLWALVLPYEFGYKVSRNLYNYWKIANERRHPCSTLIQVVSTFRTKNSGSFQISFSKETSLTYLSMYIWTELLVKGPPEFLESSFFFNVFNFPSWLFALHFLE